MKSPTLYDLDLSSARRISHYRYVRHDAPTPAGWTDDGPCPGHHGHWSRMAKRLKEPGMNATAVYASLLAVAIILGAAIGGLGYRVAVLEGQVNYMIEGLQ